MTRHFEQHPEAHREVMDELAATLAMARAGGSDAAEDESA